MLNPWGVGYSVILVCIFATSENLASSSSARVPTTVGLLRVLSDRHCNCLHAEYVWRNVTVLMESFTERRSAGRIISRVLLMRLEKATQVAPIPLTVLEIPSEDHQDVSIDGISELVVSAARNTSFTVGKSSIPDLTDLVPMYDTMFEKLHQYTRSWPFTQARLTIFYHFSIIHAAQRLREGVPRQDACPPYQGYGTHKAGGLFVCRQEYEDVFFRRAVGQLQEQPFGLPELIRLSGQKEHINLEDVIEALARLNACGSIECDVPGCSSYRDDFGWHILGSDTGCCGDYPSCCVFADPICFFHDILCRCCSYFVCPEPYCKPAPSCPNATIV